MLRLFSVAPRATRIAAAGDGKGGGVEVGRVGGTVKLGLGGGENGGGEGAVGFTVGLGDAVGVGTTDAVAVAVGTGDAVAVTTGVGKAVAVGVGTGVAGEADGELLAVGIGVTAFCVVLQAVIDAATLKSAAPKASGRLI